jgi:hypothetical protein
MVAFDRRRLRGLPIAWLLLSAACQYAPQRLPVVEARGPAAFAACRHELALRYGRLLVHDAAGFRLQSDWVAVGEPTGERQATLFLDGADLVIAVAQRRLLVPWFGLPYWGDIEPDVRAERELAGVVAQSLAQLPQ